MTEVRNKLPKIEAKLTINNFGFPLVNNNLFRIFCVNLLILLQRRLFSLSTPNRIINNFITTSLLKTKGINTAMVLLKHESFEQLKRKYNTGNLRIRRYHLITLFTYCYYYSLYNWE